MELNLIVSIGGCIIGIGVMYALYKLSTLMTEINNGQINLMRDAHNRRVNLYNKSKSNNNLPDFNYPPPPPPPKDRVIREWEKPERPNSK